MPKLDRYLFGEFAQSFLATLIVLLVVSVGGVMADLLGQIAEGKIPAGLMLSQMGLEMLTYVPIYVLPLALMLGLLLAFARLYRDSEMAVITSIGIGPRRMLRPLSWLVVPVVAVVAVMSIWVGPWADRTADAMIKSANRSLIVAGLEAGKFTSLGNGAMVYIGALSDDGKRMRKVFLQRTQKDGRIDVVTADNGQLLLDTRDAGRYLQLNKGFRVESPLGGGLDYKLARFAGSESALPEQTNKRADDDPGLLPTSQLFNDPRPAANAQLHARITPPLLALGFALLTLPLARTSPRQARYGRMMLGFLAYLVGTLLMNKGVTALADGHLPAKLGLWWLSLPLLAFAIWFYLHDGKLSAPKHAGRAQAQA